MTTSNFPDSVDNFVSKLNYSKAGHLVSDEIINLDSSKTYKFMHDNVMKNKTIEVWTGENKTGSNISDFTLFQNPNKKWEFSLVFGASVSTGVYYVSYYSRGDEIDAEDLTKVEDAISALEYYILSNGTGGSGGTGNMSKAIYDTNDDGKVDVANAADTVPWSGVYGKPSTFNPASHTHAISEVTGLQSALDGKSDTGHTHTQLHVHANKISLDRLGISVNDKLTIDNVEQATDGSSVEWSDVLNKPTVYPPNTHTHNINGVTGLQSALDGKSDVNHTHSELHAHSNKTLLDKLTQTGTETFFDLSDFVTSDQLDGIGGGGGTVGGDMYKSNYDSNDDGKVNAAEAADTVPWGGITSKPTEFEPTAHTHNISEIVALQDALDGKSDLVHTHIKATASVDGFMSKEDKAKLNAIEENAEANTVFDVNGMTGNVELTASDIGAEESFSKNTAFNKNFGNTADTVSEGNHTHPELHEHSNKNILDNLSEDSGGILQFKGDYIDTYIKSLSSAPSDPEVGEMWLETDTSNEVSLKIMTPSGVQTIALGGGSSEEPVTTGDYYVSTTGNDSNDGSFQNPWRTVQKACNAAQAGKTVLIRGGTYNEKVVFNNSGNSTDGNIVFKNYNNETVTIDGDNVNSTGVIMNIYNKSHITLDGLNLINGMSGTAIGISVEGACQNIIIKNCKISEIHTQTSDGHGIMVYGTNGSSPISGLVIDNCEIFNCTLGSSESMVVNGNINGFQITNNIIHDNDNIGIDVIGGEGVANNNDQARNGVISNNVIYNITALNNPAYGGSLGADGIYVDGGRDVIVEHNIVYNCDIGIEIGNESQLDLTTGVIARNNIVYGCDLYGIAIGGYDPPNTGETKNCKILNNTLYNNTTAFACQASSQNIIENNIIYDTGILFDELVEGTNSIEYNVLYGSSGIPSNLSSTNTVADPKFVNANTHNFELKSDSPAIGHGNPNADSSVGTLDYKGNTRIYETIDCGAIESTYSDPVAVVGGDIITDGLILYLNKDYGFNTTTWENQAPGYSDSATIEGSPIMGADGLVLTGGVNTEDIYYAAPASITSVNTPFTLEFIIKPSDVSSGYALFSDYDMAYFNLEPGGNWVEFSNNTLTNSLSTYLNYTYNINQTYHITVTYDGNTGFRLFVDGNSVSSATVTSPIVLCDGNILIGYEFGGAVACVRIYNKELNDNEVLQNYLTGLDLGI